MGSHNSDQETDKSEFFNNNTVQQEIVEPLKSSCSSLNVNDVQTVTTGINDISTEVNKMVLSSSSQETQVSDVCRSDLEDYLFTVNDAAMPDADTAVLCISQHRHQQQLCSPNKPGSVVSNSPVTEKTSLPNSLIIASHEQDKMSPSSNELLPVGKTVLQLVDNDYDADSDSVDEDVAMDSDILGSGSVQINKSVGFKLTDESTDSVSDDSDSNCLVDKSCKAQLTSAHDSTSDATTSCDEKIEVHTNVNASSLEGAKPLSPPLSYMKKVTKELDYEPVLSQGDVMDIGTSVEDKNKVHIIETPLTVSNVSIIATPSVSTEVTSSIFSIATPSVSTPATHPPVLNNTGQSVCPLTCASSPVDTANLTTTTPPVSSVCNHNLSHASDKDASLDDQSSLDPVTTIIQNKNIMSSFVSSKATSIESHTTFTNTGIDYEDNNVLALYNFATSFVFSTPLEKVVTSSTLPVSTAYSKGPVFISSNSIPSTCSSSVPELHTSVSIQSISIPVPTSQIFSTTMNDNLSTTVTQVSSETTKVLCSSNEDTTTLAISMDEDQVTSSQSSESCQTDKQESFVPNDDDDDDDDDDTPVNTFPAALKLSINLSVLPQKKKVLQRAKWAALLTTPLPILRERKRPPKSTVTVKSTVIKSDGRKGTPKKQPQLTATGSQHKIGDVMWCKFSHWDLWPCQIILHTDVNQPEPTPDQVITVNVSTFAITCKE